MIADASACVPCADAASVANAGAAVSETGSSAVMLRRHVPDDNSCLFSSIAYVGASAEDREADKRDQGEQLRAYCAEQITSNDCFFGELPNDVILGQSNEEYAKWIKDPFHWGGENEILILAKKYNIQVAMVSCESLTVSVYNETPQARGRGFILYTGQHYDPLVADSSPTKVRPDGSAAMEDKADALAAAANASYAATDSKAEVRLLPCGDDTTVDWEVINKAALEIAKVQQAIGMKRAAEAHTKAIKCLGCGKIVADTQAFQEHCMDEDADHDEDFTYECEEVVVCDGEVVQKLKPGTGY